MARDLRFERTYPHPIERVWSAVATAEGLSHWLMPNDFEPVVGHRFRFQTQPAPGFDGIVESEVLEIDAPRRLVFTWKGGGIDTTVSIVLTEVASGTALVLEQRGFSGVRGFFIRQILGNGWKGLLTDALAQHLDQEAP